MVLFIYMYFVVYTIFTEQCIKLKRQSWVKVLFMKFYWHATRAGARFVLVLRKPSFRNKSTNAANQRCGTIVQGSGRTAASYSSFN